MSKLTFHLIPHTHWDREWYLPRGQLGARLVPAVDDLIAILEHDSTIPGFLLDGQTVLLEDYLRVRPEQTEVVRRLVRNGRIETGPWYVLADELTPSGESLVRNLLLGQADVERLGGGLGVMYSPDAFGHPAVLPTLAGEFGIETAVAWRGITSDRDLLRWRGPDGRELVLYHLPPDGYEIGSGLSTEPGRVAATWETVRAALVSRASGQHVAVFIGADHHAARRDLPRLRDLITRLEPEHEVRLSRLGDYMRAAKETPALRVISGELRDHGYTWTLQGVHGTRAHQKRRNSRTELWLERYAEPLAALGRRGGGRDRRPLLTWAWRTLVQSHFHDAIGGCASDSVAREEDVRFTEVEGIVREVVRGSVQDVWGVDPDRAREQPGVVQPSLLLWNPVARPREGIVLAQVTSFRKDILVGPPGNRVPRTGEKPGHFVLRSSRGDTIPVQILEIQRALERLDASRHYPDQDEVDLFRIAFEAPAVGGLEGEVLSLVPGDPVPVWHGAVVEGRRLANEQVEIVVEADGSLTVLDRGSGEEYSGLLRLEAEIDLGDTYSFAPARPPRIARATGAARVRTVAGGPMVAAVEVRSSIRVPRSHGKGSNGKVDAGLLLMLHRDDPVVRCSLRLDNQALDHRLRARFPTGVEGRLAAAGAQFGFVERAAARDRARVMETPVNTSPAHRYVGVGGRRGFALFAPGFFEYELESGGDVLLTLLRAVGQLSRNDLATRPGHAGWPTATPLAQCPGEDTVDFAFVLGGGWGDPVRLQRQWEDVFLPLKAAWYRDWNGSPSPRAERGTGGEGIELVGEGLVLSTIKPAVGEGPDGIVLRCYNLRDEPVEGSWRFGFPLNRAQRTRADETPLQDLPLEDGGRAVRFTAGRREIVTLVVR